MTGDPHAENRRLREEIRRLKAENEDLRCFLNVEADENFLQVIMSAYGVTRQLAFLVEILHNARGRCVNRELVMAALPGRERTERDRYKLDHVMVSKIRSKVGADRIITHFGTGYALSKDFVAELDILFDREIRANRPQGALGGDFRRVVDLTKAIDEMGLTSLP